MSLLRRFRANARVSSLRNVAEWFEVWYNSKVADIEKAEQTQRKH